MLDEKKIKEAEINVKNYLDEGLLKSQGFINFKLKDLYFKNSQESISVAEFLFDNNKSPLWIVVSSYYSMYYIANAVLLNLKYKVGDKISHKVTADSLIVLVRGKLRRELIEAYEVSKEEALEIAGVNADDIIQSFDFELHKRSKFQYDMTASVMRTKAETSLTRAKIFLFEMEKLLK